LALKVSLRSTEFWRAWSGIARLYREDPITHVYVAYDILYEGERTDVHVSLGPEGKVRGYLLVWRGGDVLGVHVWGSAEELLDETPLDSRMVVHVHSPQLLDALRRLLSRGSAEERIFVDMALSREEFKLHEGWAVKRLLPDDAELLVEIKREQGRQLSPDRAREMLSRQVYYGVELEGRLISIAGTYVRMPEVWIVGDVYTIPGYRGRGFAKAVVSAISRDAIAAGATPALSVDANNAPALRLYRQLGYVEVSRKPWIFYTP